MVDEVVNAPEVFEYATGVPPRGVIIPAGGVFVYFINFPEAICIIGDTDAEVAVLYRKVKTAV